MERFALPINTFWLPTRPSWIGRAQKVDMQPLAAWQLTDSNQMNRYCPWVVVELKKLTTQKLGIIAFH